MRRIDSDGLLDRDPTGLVEFAIPDVELVNPPEAVEPGIRRGRAQVAYAVRSAHELFESHRHEVHELFDCGEAVVAAVHFCARARGPELVQEEAHTWTSRDGRIARVEWSRDLRAALAAVGLRE